VLVREDNWDSLIQSDCTICQQLG